MKRGSYALPWLKCIKHCQAFEETPIEKWDEYHLLGYLIDRTGLEMTRNYSESNGYTFSEETSPRRHPHLQNMRRLIARLHGKQYIPSKGKYEPKKVKAYLDWALKEAANKAFSVAYFMHEDKIARFSNRKPETRIDRSERLPDNVIELFPRLETWGDLSFYSRAMPDCLIALGEVIDLECLEMVV